MSNIYIGSNVGNLDMASTVTTGTTGLQEGTSSLTADVQVNILSTNSPKKQDIVRILLQIIRYIEDGRTTIFPGV